MKLLLSVQQTPSLLPFFAVSAPGPSAETPKQRCCIINWYKKPNISCGVPAKWALSPAPPPPPIITVNSFSAVHLISNEQPASREAQVSPRPNTCTLPSAAAPHFNRGGCSAGGRASRRSLKISCWPLQWCGLRGGAAGGSDLQIKHKWSRGVF